MKNKKQIFRVALIGPESTGKTTLCEELAGHYQTNYVPEFSRDYIKSLNKKYTEADVYHCIRSQQMEEELQIQQANKLFFADTESIMGKVWLQDVFHQSPEWVDELIVKYKYDLYLLTSADLPFVEDPVRENPRRRNYFFDWYERELKERNLNYYIIKGISSSRITNAMHVIDRELQSFTEHITN